MRLTPQSDLRDVSAGIRAAAFGDWSHLPEEPTVRELTVLTVSYGPLLPHRPGLDLDRLDERWEHAGPWDGALVELLQMLATRVRSWHWSYVHPVDGDKEHRATSSLYRAIRERLLAEPDAVRVLPPRLRDRGIALPSGPSPTPAPRCYWVSHAGLLAGAYPMDAQGAEPTARIEALWRARVRVFVNLMEPDEKNLAGAPFVPYEPVVRALARDEDEPVTLLRF
ncbi:hypothetical protein EON77_21035, partial [bacterium]